MPIRSTPIEDSPVPTPPLLRPIVKISRKFELGIVGGGVGRVRRSGTNNHENIGIKGCLTILNVYSRVVLESRMRGLGCLMKSEEVDGRFVARVDGSVVQKTGSMQISVRAGGNDHSLDQKWPSGLGLGHFGREPPVANHSLPLGCWGSHGCSMHGPYGRT